MAQRRRLLIVDDHPLMRRGLRDLLAEEPDLEVVAEAAGRAEALEAAEKVAPDLALVDLSLHSVADGLALVRELHAARPDLAIVVVSMYDERVYAERVLRAGARGFVNKHEPPEVFLERVRVVLRGGVGVSKDVSQTLVWRALGKGQPHPAGDASLLSDRELEIFALIGEGESVRRIAERLGVSPKTVETHRERIKSKLGLATANELVARAVRFLVESAEAPPQDR